MAAEEDCDRGLPYKVDVGPTGCLKSEFYGSFLTGDTGDNVSGFNLMFVWHPHFRPDCYAVMTKTLTGGPYLLPWLTNQPLGNQVVSATMSILIDNSSIWAPWQTANGVLTGTLNPLSGPYTGEGRLLSGEFAMNTNQPASSAVNNSPLGTVGVLNNWTARMGSTDVVAASITPARSAQQLIGNGVKVRFSEGESDITTTRDITVPGRAALAKSLKQLPESGAFMASSFGKDSGSILSFVSSTFHTPYSAVNPTLGGTTVNVNSNCFSVSFTSNSIFVSHLSANKNTQFPSTIVGGIQPFYGTSPNDVPIPHAFFGGLNIGPAIFDVPKIVCQFALNPGIDTSVNVFNSSDRVFVTFVDLYGNAETCQQWTIASTTTVTTISPINYSVAPVIVRSAPRGRLLPSPLTNGVLGLTTYGKIEVAHTPLIPAMNPDAGIAGKLYLGTIVTLNQTKPMTSTMIPGMALTSVEYTFNLSHTKSTRVMVAESMPTNYNVNIRGEYVVEGEPVTTDGVAALRAQNLGVAIEGSQVKTDRLNAMNGA